MPAHTHRAGGFEKDVTDSRERLSFDTGEI
jgi:hypothetical protein